MTQKELKLNFPFILVQINDLEQLKFQLVIKIGLRFASAKNSKITFKLIPFFGGRD